MRLRFGASLLGDSLLRRVLPPPLSPAHSCDVRDQRGAVSAACYHLDELGTQA